MMSFKKENYYTYVKQAKDFVTGFREVYARFNELVILVQCSKSLISNFTNNLALLACTLEDHPLKYRLMRTIPMLKNRLNDQNYEFQYQSTAWHE